VAMIQSRLDEAPPEYIFGGLWSHVCPGSNNRHEPVDTPSKRVWHC
jgi:hypothetical protein